MELHLSNICILGRIYDYTPMIQGKYTPKEVWGKSLQYYKTKHSTFYICVG